MERKNTFGIGQRHCHTSKYFFRAAIFALFLLLLLVYRLVIGLGEATRSPVAQSLALYQDTPAFNISAKRTTSAEPFGQHLPRANDTTAASSFTADQRTAAFNSSAKRATSADPLGQHLPRANHTTTTASFIADQRTSAFMSSAKRTTSAEPLGHHLPRAIHITTTSNFTAGQRRECRHLQIQTNTAVSINLTLNSELMPGTPNEYSRNLSASHCAFAGKIPASNINVDWLLTKNVVCQGQHPRNTTCMAENVWSVGKALVSTTYFIGLRNASSTKLWQDNHYLIDQCGFPHACIRDVEKIIFGSVEELVEWVVTINRTVMHYDGVTIKMSAMFGEIYGHALADAIYPGFLALAKFGYQFFPARLFLESLVNERTSTAHLYNTFFSMGNLSFQTMFCSTPRWDSTISLLSIAILGSPGGASYEGNFPRGIFRSAHNAVTDEAFVVKPRYFHGRTVTDALSPLDIARLFRDRFHAAYGIEEAASFIHPCFFQNASMDSQSTHAHTRTNVHACALHDEGESLCTPVADEAITVFRVVFLHNKRMSKSIFTQTSRILHTSFHQIETTLQNGSSIHKHVSFSSKAVDLYELPFRQQLRIFAQTDVLVSSVGTAQLNAVYLRPGSVNINVGERREFNYMAEKSNHALNESSIGSAMRCLGYGDGPAIREMGFPTYHEAGGMGFSCRWTRYLFFPIVYVLRGWTPVDLVKFIVRSETLALVKQGGSCLWAPGENICPMNRMALDLWEALTKKASRDDMASGTWAQRMNSLEWPRLADGDLTWNCPTYGAPNLIYELSVGDTGLADISALVANNIFYACLPTVPVNRTLALLREIRNSKHQMRTNLLNLTPKAGC